MSRTPFRRKQSNSAKITKDYDDFVKTQDFWESDPVTFKFLSNEVYAAIPAKGHISYGALAKVFANDRKALQFYDDILAKLIADDRIRLHEVGYRTLVYRKEVFDGINANLATGDQLHAVKPRPRSVARRGYVRIITGEI